MQDRCIALFREVQDTICSGLERADGGAPFREDLWDRPGGGGGRSRVLVDGGIFEKAGVNFSEVHGELDPAFAGEMPGDGPTFHATGISLVLHPASPRIPSVHANFRRIERGSAAWFGGGADLTPYIPCDDDARHFHRTLKAVCDRHGHDRYPDYKAHCDRYFHLPHRGEMRGVGGIFFDGLGGDPEAELAFVADAARSFLDTYLPIVERHRDEPSTERERRFQLLRRGRYAEFNLLYDRGTRFGLKTAGRVESILISMPPLARWEYDFRPEPGSDEAAVIAMLQPRDWAS
jgi:coproporphyrinogen III oxidase